MSDAPKGERRGPGLAKTRKLPLFLRGGERVRTVDARWVSLLEGADSMSEGSVRDETDGRVWYGTTSMIVDLDTTVHDRAFYVALVQRDLHMRLRVLRAAFREAKSRAPRALGKMVAEIRISEDPRGLRIDVDVQAPLIERRRGQSSPAR